MASFFDPSWIMLAGEPRVRSSDGWQRAATETVEITGLED